MNSYIESEINKITIDYNNKFEKLNKEKELYINNLKKLDELISVFEKCFNILNFKSIKIININKNGRVSFGIEPENTFEFYIFKGYKKDGSSINYDKMLTKALKLSNDIEHMLSQFNIYVGINQHSLEIYSNKQRKLILMDIYYK